MMYNPKVESARYAFQNAEALRATSKGEDDEWDEQDDEALVGGEV